MFRKGNTIICSIHITIRLFSGCLFLQSVLSCLQFCVQTSVLLFQTLYSSKLQVNTWQDLIKIKYKHQKAKF